MKPHLSLLHLPRSGPVKAGFVAEPSLPLGSVSSPLFSPTAAWLPSPPPRKELRVSLLVSSLVLHPEGRPFRPRLTSERASRFAGPARLLPPLPWCHISSLHPASVPCPSSNSGRFVFLHLSIKLSGFCKASSQALSSSHTMLSAFPWLQSIYFAD